MSSELNQAISVEVIGTVQGVGFRPFVHALASQLELTGSVRNEAGRVWIELEGPPAPLRTFLKRMGSEAPPLARIEHVRWHEHRRATGSRAREFSIEPSEGAPDGEVFVAPDIATCGACLAEMHDPADRRFAHAFISCVSCGPRYTIMREPPFDRERTTMQSFALCEACLDEFRGPGDRRFHAQTIACPRCGPRLRLAGGLEAVPADADPVEAAARLLRHGGILAVKGIGGFHLACDARNGGTVARLRALKRRDHKPLAVMVADFAQVDAICEVSGAERSLLGSPERPIVLLRQRSGAGVASAVNAGNPLLGVMLPYSPLHHLLLEAFGRDGLAPAPLVMTSGNESDHPIVHEDAEAHQRLRSKADWLLLHDRPIQARCDDSVARIMPGGQRVLLRRSRGYAPGALRLPHELARPVLATGGDLKNTFALGRGAFARLSHHAGELGEASSYDAYAREIARYEELFGIRPEVIVHDAHPGYLSVQYALERASREGRERLEVQHHHAHLASAMAEHGLKGQVIGVIFDGTGYGTDGCLWGGEFLLGGYASFERGAHLAYVAMPGGERAVREPWRMALAHLEAAHCDREGLLPVIPEAWLESAARMIRERIHSPLTSSMGRLFDAVAAILGLRMRIGYEAQAALELEGLATQARDDGWRDRGDAYGFGIGRPAPGQPIQVNAAPLISRLVRERREGHAPALLARRFHRAVAAMVARTCELLRAQSGLSRVVLSGGVFANALVFDWSVRELRDRGFEVFWQSAVPPGDGGLSLGQLAVAAARLSEGEHDVPGDSR